MIAEALPTGVAVADSPQPVREQSAGRGGPVRVGAANARHGGMAGAAWIGVTDVVSLLGIVVAIPFVILAVGVPIALVVQLLLWLARLF